jgi:hypothetical protein
VHEPLVTVAAWTGEARNVDGIATIDITKRLIAPNSDNVTRVWGDRLIMEK